MAWFYLSFSSGVLEAVLPATGWAESEVCFTRGART